MELTKEQIDLLYAFTRKHYVEHYDLQTELVDHLANDIEEIWKKHPDYSFSEARNVAFKKFGVFGFMEVVEQKQKQMTRKYWKILFGFMKEWFELPKIVLTISAVVLCYYLLQIKWFAYPLYAIFVPMAIYIWIKLRKVKKKMGQKPRRWMLEDMLLVQGNVAAFVLGTYPLHMVAFIDDMELSGGFLTWLLSTLIICIALIIYISIEIIPGKVTQLMEKNYPEYKFSRNL